MTARSSIIALENITRDLVRTTRPCLPPAPGFDGDVEYAQQVEIWKNWIAWEKDDPLVVKDEDLAAYKARILYAYKQALMALRFWPEMWYDAAEFCFQNDLVKEGNEFLLEGVNANPESCLLAFKRADRIELTQEPEEGEEGVKRRGDAVREPYNKLLDALYELVVQTKKREERTIARVKDMFAQNAPPEESESDDDDDEDGARKPSKRETALQIQIRAIEAGNNAQTNLLKKTISYTWIALMRAMRRIQGKGKPNGTIGGFRQIFADARKKGRILSEVYVTSALIEYHCYQDPAATKIFERGMKLFPDDETFALEYLKHLIAINDITSKSYHTLQP
jgi:cleavage stimulation factor subunit 3